MLEHTDHWTPPDSLGYSSLRPVRLSGLGYLLAAAAAATFIGAFILGIVLDRVARRQTADHRLLLSQGIVTDAVITRVWRTGDSGDPLYRMAYTFDHNGRSYSNSTKVPARIWRNLAAGDKLGVRFMPSQPSINHPTVWSSKPLAAWVPYLVAPILAVSAMMMLIPLRRQARLLMEGRPAPGHITGVKKADKTLVVRYEFPLLSGAIAKGKYNTSKVPAADKTLCVLYDPENPRRNAPYPLSLVRLESAASPRRSW